MIDLKAVSKKMEEMASGSNVDWILNIKPEEVTVGFSVVLNNSEFESTKFISMFELEQAHYPEMILNSAVDYCFKDLLRVIK